MLKLVLVENLVKRYKIPAVHTLDNEGMNH